MLDADQTSRHTAGNSTAARCRRGSWTLKTTARTAQRSLRSRSAQRRRPAAAGPAPAVTDPAVGWVLAGR